MPLNQKPSIPSSTFTVKSTESNKDEHYKRQEMLGSGLFSDVYRVTDEKQGEYALKIIKLDNPHLSSADRASLLRQLKKEIGILKDLDLLKGFKKEKDTIMILQPFLGKETAAQKIIKIDKTHSYSSKKTDNDEILTAIIDNALSYSSKKKKNEEIQAVIKECFLELMKIHDKGIVHLDAHANNFLLDPKTQKPILIDYGFAQRKNKYNAIEDNAIFVLKFKDIFNYIGESAPANKLFGYYVESVKKYVKENKMQLAFNVFAYGVVSIAAVYGLGTVAAAQLLMWAYCKTIALDFMTDWFSSVLERNQAQLVAQQYLNGGSDETGKQAKTAVKQGHVIVSLLLLWGIYRNYDSPLNLVQKLISMTAENSLLSQAFWTSAFQSISALDLGNAALFYYPAANTYKYLSSLFEATFASEKSLVKDCENIAYPKGIFNYFKSTAPRKSPTEPATKEFESGYVPRKVALA